MPADPRRVKELFVAALDLPDAAARQALLDRECVNDSDLRQRLDVLLGAHHDPASVLNRPLAEVAPVDPGATGVDSSGLPPIADAPSAAESVGTRIAGRYKLLEEIGEGGMGTVWMAQQQEPVKRLVAVKLIKAGMDSRQVIARFEAERQALALMDHAHIARVLDAGTTGAGRPYFVMDLVKGVPITRYCDEHHLTLRQRLELFLPVCQAVQHAHQKGIIHRDLKPSNVLVALYDGRPVPKVIDFGVAKAAGQSLTDKTLVTGFGSIVGTLEYMSPEQAEINQLDIDTRSDIYSLGVLLYELLTGSPPFSRKELEKAGMLEMLRVIREQEPSKPSTKLSTAEGLPTLAANRGTEPAKLTKLVRGELDWIVMKALEKDRTRRYETANGFAQDVQRYLADEPVLACPPSVGYRLRKFVRRNKGPVIAAGVILLSLVAGIIGTSAGLIWAVRERDDKAKALIAETQAKETEIKQREAKEKALVAETKARAAEKHARDLALAALRDMTDVIVENDLARGTQLTEENKEFLRKIIQHFEGFAAVTADDAESRAIRAEGSGQVGIMRYRLGELKQAETAYADALALEKQLAADFPTRPEFRKQLGRCHSNLGLLFSETGRLIEAEAAYGEAVAIQKQLAADFPTQPEFRHGLAMSYNNLGILLNTTGRQEEAETAWGEALALRKQLAADFPARPEFRRKLAGSHHNLGNLLMTTGRLKPAETAYADALALRKQLAADFPARPEFRQELATSHNNLGFLLRATGRLGEAEAAYAEALAIQKQLAADFPTRPEFRRELAMSYTNLGILLSDRGRLKDAETAHTEALAIRKQLAADFATRPDLHQELAKSHNNLGRLFSDTGRLKEAEAAYVNALALQKQLAADFPSRPDFRRELAGSHNNLGLLLSDTGRLKEAETAYTDALALQRQLVGDCPNQPDLKNDLAATCVNLALLHLSQRDFRGAKAHLEEARPYHEAALRANPRNPTYRQFYRNHLTVLIETNAGLGDPAGAKQAAEKLRDLGWDPPGDAYFAACFLSVCIPNVQRDYQATKEERDNQAAFYGDEALKMLRDAVTKGYKNVEHMKQDKNLDPLRAREDFKRLLAELEAKKE
jgi:eukaryotic-like serine/threonine-protein kinase